jgi:hypothetical protein
MRKFFKKNDSKITRVNVGVHWQFLGRRFLNSKKIQFKIQPQTESLAPSDIAFLKSFRYSAEMNIPLVCLLDFLKPHTKLLFDEKPSLFHEMKSKLDAGETEAQFQYGANYLWTYELYREGLNLLDTAAAKGHIDAKYFRSIFDDHFIASVQGDIFVEEPDAFQPHKTTVDWYYEIAQSGHEHSLTRQIFHFNDDQLENLSRKGHFQAQVEQGRRYLFNRQLTQAKTLFNKAKLNLVSKDLESSAQIQMYLFLCGLAAAPQFSPQFRIEYQGFHPECLRKLDTEILLRFLELSFPLEYKLQLVNIVKQQLEEQNIDTSDLMRRYPPASKFSLVALDELLDRIPSDVKLIDMKTELSSIGVKFPYPERLGQKNKMWENFLDTLKLGAVIPIVLFLVLYTITSQLKEKMWKNFLKLFRIF